MGSVDLNADIGESFGVWRLGDDEAMLEVVTSANIACGFHAGDPAIMLGNCRAAVARGVSIGAHVGYRQLAGFGRRPMEVSASALYAEVVYQASALAGIARTAGGEVRYLKPHGALYNRIAVDAEQANAVARAASDLGLPVLGLAGSEIALAAARVGAAFHAEAFVDRAYMDDGLLAPRSGPGAMIEPEAAAQRALRMVREGVVETVGGRTIGVEADSLCVHGDTPGAADMARAVRDALTSAGIELRAFR